MKSIQNCFLLYGFDRLYKPNYGLVLRNKRRSIFKIFFQSSDANKVTFLSSTGKLFSTVVLFHFFFLVLLEILSYPEGLNFPPTPMWDSDSGSKRTYRELLITPLKIHKISTHEIFKVHGTQYYICTMIDTCINALYYNIIITIWKQLCIAIRYVIKNDRDHINTVVSSFLILATT